MRAPNVSDAQASEVVLLILAETAFLGAARGFEGARKFGDVKSENEADRLHKCSTAELRPGGAGTAGFEPATSRLTVEVSQSFTPLLVTVEARTNRYTF
jgi:hypothetical protein